MHFTDIKPASQRALSLLLSSSPKLKSVSFTFAKLEKKDLMIIARNYVKNKRIPLETEFLKCILLNCPSLKEIIVFGTDPRGEEMEKALKNLAKSLPNKPKVLFDDGSEQDRRIFGEQDISYIH